MDLIKEYQEFKTEMQQLVKALDQMGLYFDYMIEDNAIQLNSNYCFDEKGYFIGIGKALIKCKFEFYFDEFEEDIQTSVDQQLTNLYIDNKGEIEWRHAHLIPNRN